MLDLRVNWVTGRLVGNPTCIHHNPNGAGKHANGTISRQTNDVVDASHTLVYDSNVQRYRLRRNLPTCFENNITAELLIKIGHPPQKISQRRGEREWRLYCWLTRGLC
jgi:hypothetical protein